MSTIPILDQLKALGTEQTRKTYRRHGVSGDQYGVSYADLKNLKKKIKVNHDLAKQLWSSGIHDARMLALMIADPQNVDSILLDSWANDLENYPLSDAFSRYVAQTALAREKMEQWTQSDDEWIGATGWNILGYLATNDKNLPAPSASQAASRPLHSPKMYTAELIPHSPSRLLRSDRSPRTPRIPRTPHQPLSPNNNSAIPFQRRHATISVDL